MWDLKASISDCFPSEFFFLLYFHFFFIFAPVSFCLRLVFSADLWTLFNLISFLTFCDSFFLNSIYSVFQLFCFLSQFGREALKKEKDSWWEKYFYFLPFFSQRKRATTQVYHTPLAIKSPATRAIRIIEINRYMAY